MALRGEQDNHAETLPASPLLEDGSVLQQQLRLHQQLTHRLSHRRGSVLQQRTSGKGFSVVVLLATQSHDLISSPQHLFRPKLASLCEGVSEGVNCVLLVTESGGDEKSGQHVG